ncbi:MAG: ThiF family adenylyltransferase, partial [Clostridia bacterium]|nr:ThiF family adenylyltransferase [Clostridia bacterium]
MSLKEQHTRTAMLLGDEGVLRLRRAHVAVFGIGGVGGYVVEALARAGVGALSLFDADTVSESTLNRQIIALHSTVGALKVDAAAAR